MKINRHTVSLCTTCYREIPATILIDNVGVFIKKTCPAHGTTEALLERDPLFYSWVSGLKSPSIYGGYFVDVTRTCNMRCNPCYFPLEAKDPAGMFSVADIVNDCRVNAHLAPFILTGGEPTMLKSLPALIAELKKYGGVELLSNGIKLADQDYFNDIMPLIANEDGSVNLNLSIHPETDKWREVLEHCREDAIQIESCLIVIKDKESFLKAIDLAADYRGVVRSFRIKAETAIWNQRAISGDKVFVSDMLNWMGDRGKVHFIIEGRHNKPVYMNVVHNGIHFMLLSWHDVGNVDLREIACPPYYRARNGEVCNFVTTSLINEGMDKGWLKGQRIESIMPKPVIAKIAPVAVEEPVGAS